MGLTREEQRSKQRKERPDDFHPPKEQRKRKTPGRKKHERNSRVKHLNEAKKKAAAALAGHTKKTKRIKKKKKVVVVNSVARKDRNSDAYKKIKKVAMKYQAELKKNATKPELFLKGILEERNISHRFQKIIIYNDNGNFYILDFAVKKVVIELDGSHHYKGEQLKKDIARDKHLRSIGYKVIRIANSDLYKDWPEVKRRLSKAGVRL